MDKHELKFDLVLDIIEHPYNYTSEQLTEIFSDSETKEIYNILCKVDSVIRTGKEMDVEAEWDNFSQKHPDNSHRLFTWLGGRVASITVIVCTSIVAVAAGIAVTFAVRDGKVEPITCDEVETFTSSSGDILSSDTLPLLSEELATPAIPIMFEDQSLEIIMKAIAAAYGVEIKFNNNNASLHLYYKFDPALSLDEVMSQLNTFEQINIRRNGNTLIID